MIPISTSLRWTQNPLRAALLRPLGFAFARPSLVAPARPFASEISVSSTSSPPPLFISDACVQRLKQLSEKRGSPVNLRIGVDGGGCSGFKYSFALDSEAPKENDKVFEKSGVKVVVDDISYDFIRGATVDYSQEMIRSTFVIAGNPNVAGECGCKTSFTPKS